METHHKIQKKRRTELQNRQTKEKMLQNMTKLLTLLLLFYSDKNL